MIDKIMDMDLKLIKMYSKYISLKRVGISRKQRKLLKKNIELKNHRSQNRCYVIGTGPSLKEVDFLSLEGDSIVTNNFLKFNHDAGFSPTYYCFIDNVFYENENEQTLVKAKEKYKDTKFILNGKYEKQVNDLLFEDNENLFFVNLWKGFFEFGDEIDFCKLSNSYINVICFAVAYAIYLGYEEIILVGCDFSTFAVEKSVHCYDDEKEKDPLWMELMGYSFAAKTHVELNKYAINKGIKIINSTKGSLLNTYVKDLSYVKYVIK